MKVIYIAGTSHSGSTLLDLMLNAHPEIISVGESINLPRHLGYKMPRKKVTLLARAELHRFGSVIFGLA